MRTPSLLITAGEIEIAPGPKSVEPAASSYTGIMSIPMGDFPGLSLRKLGFIGATQYDGLAFALSSETT